MNQEKLIICALNAWVDYLEFYNSGNMEVAAIMRQIFILRNRKLREMKGME